ncbi:MAG: nucleotidyltransferase domain-containing protein [Phycisphaerae bacterium]
MMSVTDQVLEEMVQAIVREVDPERVYLFGSYARGEGGPDSDVDLLVVEREPFGPERSRLGEITRVRRALSTFRVAKDILVFSAEEFAHWKDSLNHIIARCLREGRLLYERP